MISNGREAEQIYLNMRSPNIQRRIWRYMCEIDRFFYELTRAQLDTIENIIISLRGKIPISVEDTKEKPFILSVGNCGINLGEH